MKGKAKVKAKGKAKAEVSHEELCTLLGEFSGSARAAYRFQVRKQYAERDIQLEHAMQMQALISAATKN